MEPEIGKWEQRMFGCGALMILLALGALCVVLTIAGLAGK